MLQENMQFVKKNERAKHNRRAIECVDISDMYRVNA